jgi:hypothetical protein
MNTIFQLEIQGKSTLRRPMHTWKDNIKISLQQILFDGVNWIHLAQV